MNFARRVAVWGICVLLVSSMFSAGAGGASAADDAFDRSAASTPSTMSATSAGEPASQAANGTETEPNDTPATATPLPRDGEVRGTIAARDRDVFAVEASAGRELSIRLDRRDGRGRFLVSVLDPNERPRTVAFAEAGESIAVDVPVDADGTWYVVITPAGVNAAGEYTLSVPDAGEAGDRPDPETDVIGWEDGYWHDDPIAVDQSDGLTQAETEAYLARAKARVEFIREAEFERNVSVEILSREEFIAETRAENRTGMLNADPDIRTLYNQQYEASFIVGEDENAIDVVEGATETSVLGFYDPRDNRLVVVSDTPETPVINNATLIHELAHALQQQRFGFDRIRGDIRSSDQLHANLGLTEGEANYIEALYEQRCANGTWECVETPPRESPDRSDLNRGAYAITYQPYSDGPVLVHRLVQRGGWEAVDAAYRNPPVSTEQIIHPPRYPDGRPANILFSDLPAPLDLAQGPQGGWELITIDTLGETWIYSMFYYQGIAYNNTIVPRSEYRSPEDGEFDTYDYDAPPSNGWGNDFFLPYRNGDRAGYIWMTKWDTPRDAAQFHRAYLDVLRGHGAERVDGRTWVIPDGPYADAFVVVRDGRTVTIVNAPTVSDLTEIYPGIRGNVDGSGSNASPGGSDANVTTGANVAPNPVLSANRDRAPVASN